MKLRADLELIAKWIRPESRVLDLGCGDASLLAWLFANKKTIGYGVEIDADNIVQAINSGVNVIQGNLEEGLIEFDDNAFDYVILSQTIQAMHHTEDILLEMLRVGKQAIVSFPNFGYWRNRLQIINGHMPRSSDIPFEWYSTPNIHWCMLGDFEKLCAKNKIKIMERTVMTKNKSINFLPNLLGSLAFYRIAKI